MYNIYDEFGKPKSQIPPVSVSTVLVLATVQ